MKDNGNRVMVARGEGLDLYQQRRSVEHGSKTTRLISVETDHFSPDLSRFVLSLCKVQQMKLRVYIDEKILGKASYNDAYHIAIATVNRLDVLVSWNFRHIVNFDKIKLFNSVNLRLGYPLIDIRSPLEFTDNENND